MKKQAIRMVVALAILLTMSVSSVVADDVLSYLFGRRGVEGSGDMVTETRHVEPFKRIISTGSSGIYVKVGGEQKARNSRYTSMVRIHRGTAAALISQCRSWRMCGVPAPAMSR
jgi:hypothetical protein